MLGEALQVGLQPRLTQIDVVAAHRDSLFEQKSALSRSHRHAPVGANDAMPWEVIVDGCENAADETRRTAVDVAVGADKPCGDRAHPADDERYALLEVARVLLHGAARTGRPPSAAQR
jgi:hypothetical protein